MSGRGVYSGGPRVGGFLYIHSDGTMTGVTWTVDEKGKVDIHSDGTMTGVTWTVDEKGKVDEKRHDRDRLPARKRKKDKPR